MIEKKEFSKLRPETREMLLMKYYSHMFAESYKSNEYRKEKSRRFQERQERRFQASRRTKNNYKKEVYW